MELQDVLLDYESKMMIEVIMKNDLGYKEEKIARTLADGNLIWNFYDQLLEGDCISTG